MLELGDSDPWAGIAGWADARRNSAWLAWLRRHAPGASVVDLAAGAGLFAVAAAKLGARRVVAVEASELADEIRALARRNGVTIEVRDSLEPCAQLDVAYAADGAVAAWKHARAWVGPRGVVGPARSRFVAALVGRSTLTDEMAAARVELARIGRTWGLDLSPVREALDGAAPYRWYTSGEQQIGQAEVVWDLGPGDGMPARTVALRSEGPEAGGVAGWWRHTLDAHDLLESAPPLVCSWGDAAPGPTVRVRFTARGGAVTGIRVR